MILELHWSMGDHACYTGIPETYYNLFGERLAITGYHEFAALWVNNPYIRQPKPGDHKYKVQVEPIGKPKFWRLYRPQRIFYEMTGRWLPAKLVQPKLYKTRSPVQKRIALCNEVGWPSRAGYAHWTDLINKLHALNFKTYAINNKNWAKETLPTHYQLKLSLIDTINFLSTVQFYIGYDSGLAHLAGGLSVPYVLICGSVPPVVAQHQSCICVIETCKNPCCKEVCEKRCLANSNNHNAEILEYILQCTE